MGRGLGLTRGQKKAQVEGKVEEEDWLAEDKTETPEERIEEEEKVTSPPATKSQKAREARKEEPPALPQDLPYPVVPTKKNKERYFKRFLEIFKGLEITMPFGEVSKHTLIRGRPRRSLQGIMKIRHAPQP